MKLIDSSQWAMLKDRLAAEAGTILQSLENYDWNAETNKKANRLMSARAEELRIELGLNIPKGTRMFAKIGFNTRVSPPKMHISASYHVPRASGNKHKQK